MIGIIGAMQEEIAVIKQDMKNISLKKIGQIEFILGSLYDKEVVLVQSGIGKVNAAITTTLLITTFHMEYVLFSGVAGATDFNLSVGDIVISTDLIQHDVDATEFGYVQGQIPQMEEWQMKASSALIEKTQDIVLDDYSVFVGRVISGNQFISNKDQKIQLGKDFKALCVDMESAAVAQVCKVLKTEFLIIRSISDSISDDSTLEYEKFLNISAKNSKNIIEKLLKSL